jgi:ABC-2 type transport system permease protein
VLKVIPLLVGMHIRSRMEYRGAFILDTASVVLQYAATYATIWVVLLRFTNLGGWNWPELAVLLSIQLFSYAIGASFSFAQFREMEELVRLGQFDALLVKPFSPWAFIAFSGFNIGYLGHIILSVGLMWWALGQVEIAWSPGLLLYLLAAVASASMVVCALMTMIGASSMVLVQSRYLYSIFFGFWELSRFPIGIYPAALQWAMVTIVPLGYISYVPAAVLLGKDVAILGPLGGPLSLIAGPLSVAVAVAHWRYCIRHYQGGGG